MTKTSLKMKFIYLNFMCLLVSSVLSKKRDNANYNRDKFPTSFSWSSLDFEFPNARKRQESINQGDFIPGVPVPLDMDVIEIPKGKKIFITIPRFQYGVPATLGYFTSNDRKPPIIKPFPNWEMNRLGNCQGITNVYRIKIDECGRLWVLDTGKIGAQRFCQPKLLVFNLKTDQVIHRYEFPQSQLTNTSNLINLVVDIRDPQRKCKDTFVYITDVDAFQLIVYDHVNQRSWNIKNRLFYPYPQFGILTINGISFDLMDGIFAHALGPIKNGDRILYFHSLASNVESYVSTSILRNYDIFKNNSNAAARDFKSFSKTRKAQASAQAMDNNGVLFYGLVQEVAIGCWNSQKFTEYGEENLEVLVADKDTLQFSSGVKIIQLAKAEDELWVMTMSLQKVWTGTINPNETNFRIHTSSIKKLVEGTKCAVKDLNNRIIFPKN
ncbi:protein yellow-like [Aphidius gifuensis]|uniref:protein yellow-like n=1 Tax=Aphidius gifuensis TaxID=684658 RepID=UPI001CDCC9D4|nr:protein yellow-like [Aphidius gifuensis]